MSEHIDIDHELITIRHYLHAHPERSFREFGTSIYLTDQLKAHGIEILHNPLETGVVGLIQGEAGPGPRIGLRADIDGLPIVEDSGLEFSSVNEGVMHGCGHDLHMTGLLGAAFWLAEHRDKFAGSIKILFQPSEETGQGARAMIDAGLVDDVEAIIGTHNNPNYAPGQLVIGGVTPSPAMLEQVLRDCPVPVNVLIRPRFGDFLYTDAEMDQMCREIDLFRRLGVNGVVIGALTPDGALDMEKMRRMMDCAGDMEVTLHRAFDMSRDPFRTLEDAVSLGCRTVLTSGQAPDAAAGIPLLARLRRQAAGRIHIMAGCGVKWWNIQQIHHETGIRTFHTTGRRAPLDSGMTYRKSTVSMGLPTLSEYEVWQTDPEEFARCAAIVHGLHETSIK